MLKTLSKITLSALIVATGALSAIGARQTTMLPGSVKNFELPHFDDKTGVKEWELFGAQAKYTNDTRIDITGIKLDLYEGKVEAKHRATIKSPSAYVNPNTRISQGDDTLEVIANEFNMSGKKWKWQGDKRFVEVFSDVKITVKPRTEKDSETTFKSQYANLSYVGDSNVFELKNNVTVKNDQMDLSCGYLHAKSLKKKARAISDIIAKGKITMLYDNRLAEAEDVVIDPEKGTAILTGDPKITDIASRSKLLGERIVLDKENKKIETSSSKRQRATAVIFHAEKDKKEQKITILADKIVMAQKDDNNLFDFIGNVNIISEEFTAKCEKLQASSISKKGTKPKLEYIRGSNNVRFENEDGIATSKSIEIIPEKQEIWLADNVKLNNPKRGVSLTADALVFSRATNKGLALSKPQDKNSFVVVSIKDTPSFDDITGDKKISKKNITSVIKSKKLTFAKDEKSINFTFIKDVKIVSDDITAQCQKLDVYAETDDKGTSSPKKIIATDKVYVSQKGYSANAEVATIYPQLAKKGGDKAKKIQKFIELSTDPQNPLLRPTITLPPLKNIGITDAETAFDAKSKPTIIKSDKQWLTTAQKADRYYFQGNVQIEGTDIKASCENIEVVMRAVKPKTQKEIDEIILSKDVKLDHRLKEVHCGRAQIMANDQIVTLTEDPIVINREDNSRATGFKIIYNHGNQSIQMESDPSAITPAPAPSQFVMPNIEDDDDETPKRRTKIRLPMRK